MLLFFISNDIRQSKQENNIINIQYLQICSVSSYYILYQNWYPQLYQQEWGRHGRVIPEHARECVGVSLKENQLYRIRVSRIWSFGVNSHETMMVDHLKKNSTVVTWDIVRITLNHFFIILYIICAWFICLITFKITIIRFVITNMSLAFLDLKLHFFSWIWSLLPNFMLLSGWSVLAIPFPTSLLLLSDICLSNLQLPIIIGFVCWNLLRLSESWTDITF